MAREPSSLHDDSGDDTRVARGFWRSLAVVAFIATLIVGFKLLRTRPTAPPGSGEPVAAPAAGAVEPVAGVVFRDVARESGVDFTHESGARGGKLLPECLGGGVAIVDLDGDGLLDLVFTQGQPLEPRQGDGTAGAGGIRIYMNRTSTGSALRFERLAGDESLAAGSYANAVAAGDIDGDGRADLYITCVGQDRLLVNQAGEGGAPRFVSRVIPQEDEWGTAAGMLDADADGDLDIVVANYVRWSPAIDRAVNYTLDGIGRAYGPPTGFEGTRLMLLVNDRAEFRDVAPTAGIAVPNPVTGAPYAKTLGLVFVDADRDGRTDILVANDRTPKFLLRNDRPLADGTPHFTDVAVASGFAFDRDGNATGAMGIDAAWPRNDAALAVAVGNFANEPSSLYMSDGARPVFSDESLGQGFGAPTRRPLAFGVLFVDVDLDGDPDLVQANGHLEPDIARVQPSQTYAQRAQLFINRGAAATPLFAEAPAETTGDLAVPAVGRALASGDLDNDGDPDLVLVDLAGRARVLVNQQATAHHWLAVDAPIGSEIEVIATIGGVRAVQRRTASPTRSYLSQCEPTARFGLGDARVAGQVAVRFPDGSMRSWNDIAADGRLRAVPAR